MDFYFAQKTFFPKNFLPNSGCGLSTGAAYTRVNTVHVHQVAVHAECWSNRHKTRSNDDLILDKLNLECTTCTFFYKGANIFNNS